MKSQNALRKTLNIVYCVKKRAYLDNRLCYIFYILLLPQYMTHRQYCCIHVSCWSCLVRMIENTSSMMTTRPNLQSLFYCFVK